MTLRAADAPTDEVAGSSPAKVANGYSLLVGNPSRIIVFIRLALLACGDKQPPSAAKTWKRTRPTLRDGIILASGNHLQFPLNSRTTVQASGSQITYSPPAHSVAAQHQA
jgi:hypothetical protein